MKKNKKENYDEPVKISEGVYWVGFYDEKSKFHCNPYLIDDGAEVVLIDPGSIPHFPIVSRKVVSLVDLKKIHYIVLQHQDPDLCASTPIFEDLINRRGLKIVTHRRAHLLISHYGVKSDFYDLDHHNFQLKLKSGRVLKFITTPYCHAPGAFTTYDVKTKILFSSDIFGAFSDEKWDLYAGRNYEAGMRAWHIPYMPSKEILRHNIEKFEKLDIDIIASQHGSIIKGKAEVKKYINILKNLECGSFLTRPSFPVN